MLIRPLSLSTMALSVPQYLLLLLINLLLISINFPVTGSPQQAQKCLLFNFGDSNSDTGGNCPGLENNLQKILGNKPGCRFADGLLYIDFLCENLGTNYLMPYLESLDLDSNFTNGANFAVSGQTAQPMHFAYSPLATQVKRFSDFQHKVQELKQKGKGPKFTEDDYHNAIFSIDIGQNDLHYFLNFSHEEIISKHIPASVECIENAAKTLYKLGGRKFLIYNTGPLGCLPFILANGKKHIPSLRLDQVGCAADCNDFAKKFNEGLNSLSTKLRLEMKNATIVYIDMYAIKYDLIANASKYGFENPLESCSVFQEEAPPIVCPDPSRFVNLDGIHYSNAANKIIASKVWSGDYASPHMKFEDLYKMTVNY